MSITIPERAGDVWSAGSVVTAYSPRFGTHDLLFVRVPSSLREERCRALDLSNGAQSELLYLSSFENDTVERQWSSLEAYYAEKADLAP